MNEYGQAEGIYAEEWNPLQSQVSVEVSSSIASGRFVLLSIARADECSKWSQFHAPAAYLITGNEIWDFIDEAERRCGFRASAIQQVPGRSTLQYPSVSVSTYVSKVMERRMFGEATAKVWVRKGRELWDFRYVPQQ